MDITTKQVKELRDQTGVSVMQCRSALEEAGGDMERALAILRKASAHAAEKKADRALGAGTIGTYVHDGVIGTMVLLSSETDFVAKNPEFGALARDIAMQVSAMNPENTDTLLEEAFIKDSGKTVRDLITEATQKFGERIEVSNFVRFSARG